MTGFFVLVSIDQMNKTRNKPITVTEAAEIIGCCRGNVLYLIRTGLIKAERLGRRNRAVWAVDTASVEAYAKLPYRTGRPRKSKPPGAHKTCNGAGEPGGGENG